MWASFALFLLAAVAPSAVREDEDPFPKRKDYPDLAYVSTADVARMRADQNAIVVDSRNAVEFNVIHVEGAVNVLSSTMKKEDLLAVREEHGERPIIFYCNGVTCSKSYKAGERAFAFGFSNCYVYDAGVMDWARTFPAQTRFFGKPMSAEALEEDLIPKERFEAACLDSEAFLAKVASGEYKVFDIRDRDERSKAPLKLQGLIKIDIDQVVAFLEKPGALPDSKLLFIDRVGRQVKWLHYYLRHHQRTDYAFLKGGIEQLLADGYDAEGKPTGVR